MGARERLQTNHASRYTTGHESSDETVGLSRDGDIAEYKRLGDRSRAIYLKIQ